MITFVCRMRRCTRVLVALAALGVLPLACSDAPTSAPATSEDACASPPLRGAGFDVYGGWKGAQTTATGRFAVAEIDGVWWLVTPEGHVLFSNGVTGIDPEGDVTGAGRTPYGDNVLARHGSVEAWRDATLARLCDLGVTTLAAWTNSTLNL